MNELDQAIAVANTIHVGNWTLISMDPVRTWLQRLDDLFHPLIKKNGKEIPLDQLEQIFDMMIKEVDIRPDRELLRHYRRKIANKLREEWENEKKTWRNLYYLFRALITVEMDSIYQNSTCIGFVLEKSLKRLGKNWARIRKREGKEAFRAYMRRYATMRATLTETDESLNNHQEMSVLGKRRLAETSSFGESLHGKEDSSHRIKKVSFERYVTQIDCDGVFEKEALRFQRIIGTCQRLERDYSVFTRDPSPSEVRPANILKQSLQRIIKLWETREIDYQYFCSQLKAIQQELDIQNIRNGFTVSVYETHARAALIAKDVGEFHRCQRILEWFRQQGISRGNDREFIAYRILYAVCTSFQIRRYHRPQKLNLFDFIDQLTDEDKEDEGISHALEVRVAFERNDRRRFIQLYKETPRLGAFLLDFMIHAVRAEELRLMASKDHDSLFLDSTLKVLGFDDIQEKEGLRFLKKCGFVCEE